MDNHPYLTGAVNGHEHDHFAAEFESPFTLTETAVDHEHTAPVDSGPAYERESPFYNKPYAAEGEVEGNPVEEAFVQFLDEMEDDEFTEALVDLQNEVERYAHEQLYSGNGVEGELDAVRQEELLQNFLQPLTVASENFAEQLSREFAQHDAETLTDEQIDEIFSRHAAQHELGNPAQEYFFKRLRKRFKRVVNRVRKVVRKVKSVVKKFSPVHMILKRLGKMVRPLLGKLIRRVINRLPGVLQAPARRLAQRFGIPAGGPQREFYDDELYDGELYDDELYDDEFYDDELASGESFELVNSAALPAAAPETELLVRELNLRLTEQLFASTEQEANAALEAYQDDSADRKAAADQARLEAARERFVQAVGTARTAEEIRPHVEEFVGTVLMVIKTGIRLIGRKKVINFVAGIFTKMIARLIGPQAAQPLARAIVEKGFDLLNLEVQEQQESRIAGETIAQVLEELTMQVATFNNEVLENNELLEQEVYEQFTQLVATNLPSQMVKEEFRESETSTAWALLPVSGKKRYKKYGRVLDLSLPYEKIRGLRTFGGQYLQSFLRHRHSVQRGQQVRVKVHIFEAIRGTTLSHISLLEKGTRGLGSARRSAWSQIHPLTPRVAGQLLGNPALGRQVADRWLRSRHRIQVRQRFYYLEVLGTGTRPGGSGVGHGNIPHKPLPVTPRFPSAHPPVRKDEAMVKLDFTRSTMTLALMMTEEKAAEITRRLRANDYGGAAMTFRTSIRDALNNILLKHAGRQVKVVMETSEELYLEEHFGGFLRRLGRKAGNFLKNQVNKIVQRLMKKLVALSETGLNNHLKRLRADFIKAQEDGAQGVTLHLVFIDMPGMALLHTAFKIIKGKQLSLGNLAGAILPSIPLPDMHLFPGRKSL